MGQVGEDSAEFWFGSDTCLLDADFAECSMKMAVFAVAQWRLRRKCSGNSTSFFVCDTG